MKIIVGLGNPEPEYKGTRHNAGFEVVNKLANDLGAEAARRKFRALCAQARVGAEKILLLKPQTYMNLSGESVAEALRFYKAGAEDLILIYDDCDLPLGAARVRKTGGPGGHNGARNVIAALGTEDIARVRVGIGRRPPGMLLSDYVLSRFPPEEWEAAVSGYTKAGDAVLCAVKEGIDKAMNMYNPLA
ncbi:MAG: aminoacyl-tRNA hydrolase [Clostridiales bacterium]|jgi:PTH1 family peptidyl-tRNA hydrolase|nr:aminoacyl-tRNA hydrolase [Clostridiales bacterium]